MTETPEEKAAVTPRAKSIWRRLTTLNVKEGVNTLAKLAAPAAVIVGAILAQNFQSSQTTTQLLAAREEADTKIRAEMFRAITEKLLGQANADTDAARKVVFAELLALNFHEHFELKPLMTDVDEALRKQIAIEADESKKHALEDSRLELVSIVRRVRERQVAMLVRPNSGSGDEGKTWFTSTARAAQASRFENGDITSISVRLDGPHPTAIKLEDKDLHSACDVPPDELQASKAVQGCVEEPFFLNAPDGRGSVALVVSRPTDQAWSGQKFKLLVKPDSYQKPLSEADRKALGERPGPPVPCDEAKPTQDRAAASSAGAVEFETTWFDLPLTDNTPLWSGSRYAVFIDRVCPENGAKGPKVVKLALMWFPRDYFPPRERPTNYRELRKKLDLQLAR